ALQEQLPELQQVPSPQGDSRATVYSAAIERLPRDRVHAQCSEQMLGGVARERSRGGVLEHHAECVHRRGVVGERGAGRSGVSAVEQVLHVIVREDRKSTRLNSSHEWISYAVFC